MADKKQGRPWYKNPAFIIPIIVAIIGAVATIVAPVIRNLITPTTPQPPDTRLEVSITSPVHNSIISGDSIQVEGYLTREMDKGQFLYTVVETQQPMWWPEQAIPAYSQTSGSYEFKCTHWITKTDEGREILEVKALVVDSAIHNQFQKWRSNCIAADDWPGIPVANVDKWGTLETCASVTAIHE